MMAYTFACHVCLLFGCFAVHLGYAVAPYSDGTCCSLFQGTDGLFTKINETYLPHNAGSFVCGQDFSPKLPSAPNAFVPYDQCAVQCPGFDLSKPSAPRTWAAPLVQFILPSIIFSMSIPRPRMFTWTFEIGSGICSSLWGLALALLTALDTMIWVAAILALAGPMMVSGLTEAVLDNRILEASKAQSGLSSRSRLRLIVTVVCGNLLLAKSQMQPIQQQSWLTKHRVSRFLLDRMRASTSASDPLTEIPCALEATGGWSDVKSKLLNLLSAQGDFGALIGAPVIYYLGSFIYTILDLLSEPSVQDAAISLAFGVEWMMLVHVAIVSCCLLASNNPSAASVLATEPFEATEAHFLPPVYKTRFQPVSMLDRGKNKKKWLTEVTRQCHPVGPPCQGVNCQTQDHIALRNIAHNVEIGPGAHWLLVVLPTLILVSLPPAAGAVVAHQTPPIGWGCRSLTLALYAGAQSLMVIGESVRHQFAAAENNTLPRGAPDMNETRKSGVLQRVARTLLAVWKRWPILVLVVSCFAGFLSLFTVLGGTIMQVTGVYKNCFCYVNTGMWLDLDNAYVNVASDTADQRNASHNWIYMGCTATGFMAACCYIGWWYQQTLRTEYRRRVKALPEGPVILT